MGKRKKGTDEKEVEEASRRMRRYPEHLRSARNSPEWLGFLRETVGIHENAIKFGGDFWEQVRVKVRSREEKRVKSYSFLRSIGLSPKEARRARDWSSARIAKEYGKRFSKEEKRVKSYSFLRSIGLSPKEARRARDWSSARIAKEYGKRFSKYA